MIFEQLGLSFTQQSRERVDPQGRGPVQPLDPGSFDLDLGGHPVLEQMLTGTYPPGEEGRSGALWQLGHLVAEWAQDKQVEVDEDYVAGIVKAVDAANYRKYSKRRDGDYQYRRIAAAALADTAAAAAEEAPSQSEQPQAASTTTPKRKRGRPRNAEVERRYTWTEADGLQLIHSTGKQQKIAQFRPTYESEREIDMGEGEVERYYEVLLHPQHGADLQVTLKWSDLVSDQSIHHALMRLAGSRFVIEAGGGHHLAPAMHDLTQPRPWPVEVQSGRTGWITITGRDSYILPSAHAAICAEGWDEEVRFNQDSEAQPLLMRYGQGVELCESVDQYRVAEQALIDFLNCGVPHVITPVLTAVLAGPLASLGLLRVSPPLLHVHAFTGSFKTTLIAHALNIFGRFEEGSGMTSWTSTANRIQYRLWLLRDLPLLVDDYKANVTTPQEVARVVQNYGDGTSRGRQSRDQKEQKDLVPAALMISAGEHAWNVNDESTMARTVFVPIVRADERSGTVGDIDGPALRLVERHVKAGHYGLVGGTYIRELARVGLPQLRVMIEEERDTAARQLGESITGIHARSIGTRASMHAAENVVLHVLRRVFPAAAAVYEQLLQEARVTAVQQMQQDAAEALQMSPFNALLDALRSQIASRDVHLDDWDANNAEGNTIGSPMSRVVGFHDADNIYLSQSVTWSWYLEWIGRQRRTSTTSWSAACREAVSAYRADLPRFPLRRLHGSTMRVLIIPKSEVDLDSIVSQLWRDDG